MNHLRRTITVVASLALSLIGLAAAAPAAFAMRVEPNDGAGSSTPVYPVTHGGMPGWLITVIALAAVAVAAAAITVIVRRVRRRPTLHPATQ